MTEALLACATVAGLVYWRTRRGPLVLGIMALVYVRAAVRCAGVCWRKALETWRQRYQECYEAIERETR